MKTYTFNEALEIASKGLEPIFTRDEEYNIDLISSFNISEITDSIKDNITYIATNFTVDESGNLLYTQNGVTQLRKALETDITFKQECEESNLLRENHIITTTSHKNKAGVLHPCF